MGERLGKFKVDDLHKLLDMFDLPRGSGAEGHKDAKVARIVDFLMEPKQLSDKDLAAQVRGSCWQQQYNWQPVLQEASELLQ